MLTIILVASTVWGRQPVLQSEGVLAPAIPSPTWMLGAGSFTAIPVVPPTGSPTEGPDGESGSGGSHAGRSQQPTPTPPAEVVKRGQRLYYEVGCFYCHGVRGQGAVGPRIARTEMSLDAVTIQVYQPAGDMPVFSEEAVSRSDVAAIYAYLQSLTPSGPRPEITIDRPDSATGAALYDYFGCSGCHGSQAEGVFGPPLAYTPRSLEDFRAQVRKPRERMPAYSRERTSDEELAHIYAFLQSLQPAEPRPESTMDRPDSATGEALYRYLGCFACHGDQAQGNIGPRLAGTALSLEEVRTQVRSPQKRMPAFGPERVSDEELAHIYAFLQGLAP